MRRGPRRSPGRQRRSAGRRSLDALPLSQRYGQCLAAHRREQRRAEQRHRAQPGLRAGDHAAYRIPRHRRGRDRGDAALAPWRHHGQSRARLGLADDLAALAGALGRTDPGRHAARLRRAADGQGRRDADRRREPVVRSPAVRSGRIGLWGLRPARLGRPRHDLREHRHPGDQRPHGGDLRSDETGRHPDLHHHLPA